MLEDGLNFIETILSILYVAVSKGVPAIFNWYSTLDSSDKDLFWILLMIIVPSILYKLRKPIFRILSITAIIAVIIAIIKKLKK